MSINKVNGIAFVQIIAALLIVNYNTSSLGIPILSQTARFGFIFNTVFVFLSGFLLARSLSVSPAPSYSEFIYKRFNRIYPSFHVALILISLIYLWIGQDFTISSLLLSATGFSYFWGDSTFGIHLWFVSVILACYLVCIPTYFALKRSPLTFFMLLLIISLIVVFLFEDTFHGVYGKVSGVVVYRFLYHYIVFSLALYLGMQRTEIASQRNQWKWMGVFALVFPLYIITQEQSHFGLIAIATALLVAICTIQIFLMVSSFFEKQFSYVFLLSGITYEIYLIHYVVIAAIDINYHGEYVAYPLVFFVSILLSYLISIISKRYEWLTRRCTGWLLR